MYSGITGLRNFQTKLDVIGNNISNVNTYGFKKGRTVFKDLVSQTVAGASGPTGTQGGTNPRQVGLGSQLATIDTLHGQGSSQFTGNTLDLAITGDGFFIVMDGNEPVYTRAGNFYMDREGHLVDGDGRYVQGNLVAGDDNTAEDATIGAAVGQIRIPPSASSMSIGQDGTVYYVDVPELPDNIDEDIDLAKDKVTELQEAIEEAVEAGADTTTLEEELAVAQANLVELEESTKAQLMVAGQIRMATFNNPGGLEKVGGNLFRESANSGTANTGFALTQGFGTMESGFLEMSNVDLAEEFTEMIVAQRGFQANTRIITTSDEILQELVNLKR